MVYFTTRALHYSLAAALSALWWTTVAVAQPATVQYHDCFSGNLSQKLNVSTVYAQVLHNEGDDRHLNITVLGEAGQSIVGQSQTSASLATLFTDTEVLTLNVWNNRSYFCDTLRPPSPLPSLDVNVTDYCPIPAGPFAFSSYIPLSSAHELTTLSTRLRAVDPFSIEIFCVDVYVTPLKPGLMGSVYGHAIVVFWSGVALAIAYWTVVGIARVVSAWDRGTTRTGSGWWSKVEGAGYIFASALSGERFASSPALMRFCTPSMRDIFFHTQWCAALAMVAVQWPRFVYPLLAQTSWATLTYNITLTQKAGTPHWNPLTVDHYEPQAVFSEQLNDPASVLYVDAASPNTLFMLPAGTNDGIPSFAASIGLREQDLFGVCLSLFLALVAAALALSLLIHILEWLGAFLSKGSHSTQRSGTRSPGPRYASAGKDTLDTVTGDEDRSMSSHYLFRGRAPQASKSWKRRLLRSGLNSFHGSILHGNLVRLLILFHFPITIFSCHQMTLGRSHATLISIALAAVSFSIISVLIPVLLVFRLISTSTNKLYDETGTLLALGPLYNHYRHGSQLFACIFFATNIAFGLTIGCGQKSGTAQAIVILIIEVASALGTSIWLPWGQGASMGLISFLFCVARIVIAVLLVILTPVVSIGQAASGWVAYAILFILGIVYATFLLLLIVKLVEAAVRIIGGIGFDRSRHVMDSGLIGACALLGCCGGRQRRSARRRRYRGSEVPRQAQEDGFALPSGHGKLPSPPPSADPSMGPPSVLRPEHAMRPYKEESDDEGGYIMRAWQPFPRPGYTPVEDTPPEPTTGFARVGGGRAHYESPYAIKNAGSSMTFPSTEQYPPPPLRRASDDEPLPTASLTSVARHPQQGVPYHVRTRSQTAIIEGAPTLVDLPGRQHLAEFSASTDGAQDDGDDSDIAEQPKKRWYNIRAKNRRHSESATSPRTNEDFEPDMPAEPSRTFVVVRKAGGSSPRVEGASSDIGPGDVEPPRRSFAVLRGPTSGG